MRDTLALALVRAELCRAHWAEHERRPPNPIGRLIHSFRRISRGRAPARVQLKAPPESSLPR